MYLNAANLPHYLVGHGLLAAAELVGGDVVVLDQSRRNRNFVVLRRGQPGLFVKQMRPMQDDAILTLRREAVCYDRARAVPALSCLMPTLLRYDEARHTLVLRLLPDAESLYMYHQRHKRLPPGVGRELGKALGLYHTQAGVLLDDPVLRPLLPRQVPVILTLERGGHDALARFGRVGPALSALFVQHGDFQRHLDRLGADWRFDCLIHGDMKWDNVLLFPTAEQMDFRVVDWELADIGDAGWDVGGVLQSFLSAWIQSMPIASGLPPVAYVGMATRPLHAMRPAMREFWDTYTAAREFHGARRDAELERCMRFAAAKLAWSTAEQCAQSPALDPVARAALQVSLNVVADPARAVRELLGV